MKQAMNDLNVTLVQPDVQWKNPGGNLERYDQMLSRLTTSPDLILFPEMFQTGFCTDPETMAETMDGHTVRWMTRTSAHLKCSIAGSVIIRDNRRFFNRLIYIDRFQNLTWYDKRHLFVIEQEEAKYTAGLERLVVPLNGWLINFQICYDLRFPVWARNQDDYDVLVNLANWPASRDNIWNTLLRARAIENQCYSIGVNRVGEDGNKIVYSGNSMIIDPKGIIIKESPDAHEDMLSASLSWVYLDEFRKKFPVWRDRDNFTIEK